MGYSLIVSRYDMIRKNSTTIMATVMGTTRLKANTPTAGMRMRRISSVAYADDEMQSDENTATAVGIPRRSCSSASLCSGGPSRRFLSRYPPPSGRIGTGCEGAGAGGASVGLSETRVTAVGNQ